MKNILPILLLLVLFSACSEDYDEALPSNYFETAETYDFITVTSFTYIPQDFQVRVTFERDYSVLSEAQIERIDGLYVLVNGERRDINNNENDFVRFPATFLQEYCLRFGLRDDEVSVPPGSEYCDVAN